MTTHRHEASPESKPIDESALFRTCELIELGSLSQQGWELVSTHKIERSESYQEQETSPPMQGNSYPFVQNLCKSRLVKTRICILRLGKDQRVAELERTLNEQRGSISQLKLDNEAVEKRAKVFETECANHKARVEAARGDLSDLNERFKQSEAAKRKLEVDLGKIRTVIGEKAFKEIFAEEKA
jgi:chromosome segregation ATPase